jgi:hypothetical protein
VSFPLFGHMLLVSGTVSAPSSIFQNLCVSFPFLRSRLGWLFFLDLVLLVRFVGTLPNLNDLFLLEGRSTSSITISYSILFHSAPGLALPAQLHLAGKAERVEPSEAKWR